MQSPNKTPATGQHWLGRGSLSADLGSGLRLLRAEPRRAGGCHTARLGPEPSAALLQAGACHQRLVKGSGFRSPDRASSFTGLSRPSSAWAPCPLLVRPVHLCRKGNVRSHLGGPGPGDPGPRAGDAGSRPLRASGSDEGRGPNERLGSRCREAP